VILSTTVAGPPLELGYFDQNGNVETFAERVTEYLWVTPLHNATGTPAMSVPLHWTADGLPVGVHFAGRYGEEATLLALAAELETAQPCRRYREPALGRPCETAKSMPRRSRLAPSTSLRAPRAGPGLRYALASCRSA
jgi:hypothetical protein